MTNESLLEKLMPVINRLTLTQIKLDQLKQKGSIYTSGYAQLTRSYIELSKELANTAVECNKESETIKKMTNQ